MEFDKRSYQFSPYKVLFCTAALKCKSHRQISQQKNILKITTSIKKQNKYKKRKK